MVSEEYFGGASGLDRNRAGVRVHMSTASGDAWISLGDTRNMFCYARENPVCLSDLASQWCAGPARCAHTCIWSTFMQRWVPLTHLTNGSTLYGWRWRDRSQPISLAYHAAVHPVAEVARFLTVCYTSHNTIVRLPSRFHIP
jgi:hypothetical protein